MARKVKLNHEQVWIIQQDAQRKSLKEYATEFGVSYPTAYNVRKCKGAYNIVFSRNFENIMQEKYLAPAVS